MNLYRHKQIGFSAEQAARSGLRFDSLRLLQPQYEWEDGPRESQIAALFLTRLPVDLGAVVNRAYRERWRKCAIVNRAYRESWRRRAVSNRAYRESWRRCAVVNRAYRGKLEKMRGCKPRLPEEEAR